MRASSPDSNAIATQWHRRANADGRAGGRSPYRRVAIDRRAHELELWRTVGIARERGSENLAARCDW
jgi:hypothetical protein